jgi:hypothetical protein
LCQPCLLLLWIGKSSKAIEERFVKTERNCVVTGASFVAIGEEERVLRKSLVTDKRFATIEPSFVGIDKNLNRIVGRCGATDVKCFGIFETIRPGRRFSAVGSFANN